MGPRLLKEPAAGAEAGAIFERAQPARLMVDPGLGAIRRCRLLRAPDGAEVPCTAEAVGRIVRVAPPAEAAEADFAGTLLLVGDAGAAVAVPIAWRALPDASAAWGAVARACAESSAASPQSAAERVSAAVGQLAPEDAHFAHVLRARCAQAARRTDEAIAAWRAGAEAAAAVGQPFERARRLRAAAFVSLQARRFGQARRLLDEAERGPGAAVEEPEGAAKSAYYKGLIELELGDLRAAQRLLHAAADGWAELGNGVDAESAVSALVKAALAQGDSAAAAAALEGYGRTFTGAPAQAAEARRRAEHLNNRAWFALELWRRGYAPLEERTLDARFAEAERLFAAWGETDGAAEAGLNRAWLAFLAGRTADAEALLRTLQPTYGGGPLFGAPATRLLLAELALRRGRVAEARDRFAATWARAREEAAGLDSDVSVRALYGEARALWALGRRDAALERYAQALAAVERMAGRAQLRGGRALFFDDRHALFEAALRAERAADRDAEALDTLLRGQARVLRGLEAASRVGRLTPAQKADWEARAEAYLQARAAWEAGAHDGDLLTADRLAAWRAQRERDRLQVVAAFDAAYAQLDEAVGAGAALPPSLASVRARLEPDAALLACARLDDAALCGLIAGDRSAAPRLFALELPADGSAPPLPGDLDLTGIAHLYVAPGDVGALRDLRGLRVGPTERWLDRGTLSLLPHAGLLGRPSADGAARRAIVADPSNNLPGARRHGRMLAARWPEALLLEGGAATGAAVREALISARALHFGGHGVLGRAEPWEAYLRLAGAARLTLTDLLILPLPPAIVVLDGCDTATDQPLGAHEAISLSDALLVAGAHAVLAADRPVRDAEADVFLDDFYGAGGDERPAEAFRHALRAAEARGDSVADALLLFGGR